MDPFPCGQHLVPGARETGKQFNMVLTVTLPGRRIIPEDHTLSGKELTDWLSRAEKDVSHRGQVYGEALRQEEEVNLRN